jgi:DNA-directed RNA polymerase specialized sigma24 family protein
MAQNDPYLQAALTAAATRTGQAAVQFGITNRADREDLSQDLLVDLLSHRDQFDPAKAGVNTFTGLVSRHRTFEVVERMVKARSRMVDLDQEAANDSVVDETAPSPADPSQGWMADDRDLFADSDALHDLCIAVDHMSDDQTALFKILETHQDLPSACKASGMTSATFYRRVADLQMHLRMFGFKAAA